MLLQKKKAGGPREISRRHVLVPKSMPAKIRDVRLSLALKKIYCYYYLIMCLCGYDRHMGAKAQRCKTDPCGAEVTGSCEPPRVGAGNQT